MEFTINSKTHGAKIVIIDNEDYDIIKDYKWGVSKKVDSFYVMRTGKSDLNIKHKVRLHRAITSCPSDKVVDHINGNTLDNRKCNLRVCTNAENLRNSRGKRNSTSKYKGVSYDKEKKRWASRICINSKEIKLGKFKSEIDAAKKYNEAAIIYHGEFAKLNII